MTEYYCNPEGYRGKVKELREKGLHAFLPWFDGPAVKNDWPEHKVIEAIYGKAKSCFMSQMFKFVGYGDFDPKRAVSLDIGYGSGGMVCAASGEFKRAIGIDVHGEGDIVRKIINADNVELFQTNGVDLVPIPDESIDFIHSWVTFMHLGKASVARGYLEECRRVLKKGGLGVIYTSRLVRGGKTIEDWEREVEKERMHPLGYQEGGETTMVNRINLLLSVWWVEKCIQEIGMLPVDSYPSIKSGRIGGQNGVIFKKKIVD